MRRQHIGNPGEDPARQGKSSGRHGEVGMHDVGLPLADVSERGKKRCRQITRHFRHRAKIGPAAEPGCPENLHAVPDLMSREIRHPDRLDTDLMAAANKRGTHIVGHPAAAATDRRIFVAQDENLHFRNRS